MAGEMFVNTWICCCALKVWVANYVTDRRRILHLAMQ
jgi:hypothetical protein